MPAPRFCPDDDRRRARWRRACLLLLAIVALASTGIVFGNEHPIYGELEPLPVEARVVVGLVVALPLLYALVQLLNFIARRMGIQ